MFGQLHMNNDVKPDQLLQNAAFDQGLHNLPFSQPSFRYIPVSSKMIYFVFRISSLELYCQNILGKYKKLLFVYLFVFLLKPAK